MDEGYSTVTSAAGPKVIFLGDAGPDLAAKIGNKAASLVELREIGFDVPNGFCIPVEVFEAWRSAGEIDPDSRSEILEAFKKLRAPVAVRSSSPAEDRADASFAGQYQTVLGVRTDEELVDAIISCWKSATSSAAASYRVEHETAIDAPMAVLVQELVPATSAGVLFTMHPVTNSVDEVVVNSNFGLGESVVSGRAEPDTFVLDKRTGQKIDVRTGSKRVWSKLGNKGVEEVKAGAGQQERLSLNDAQLALLVDAAIKLELYFDRPIDAEWAFEGEKLHLLQARPITTGYHAFLTKFLEDWADDRGLSAPADAVWAHGSPISSLPTSPLYYSEMAAFFSDMFPAVAGLHGVESPRRKEFRYFNGFAFTNREFSSTADPSGKVQPLSLTSPAWRSTLKLSARNPRTLAVWANIDRYYRNWKEVWTPEIEAARPDYATAGLEEIQRFIELIERQRRERSLYAACAVGFASDLLGLLMHLLDRWAPDASEESIGVLTSGVEGSLTHAENLEVWQLAQTALKNPDVAAIIRDGAYEQLEGMAEAGPFMSELDALRARKPHRGCADRDLRHERWGDTRRMLLEQVSNMLRLGADADPAAAHHRAAERRRALEAEIERQVARGPLAPLKLGIFRKVLRATQRYWMHRDNQRHTFDRYFYELRRAYRAMGEGLAKEGALPAADDVFFVAKKEIYAYLDGELSAERLRQRAVARRDWWHDVSAKAPPFLVRGQEPFEAEASPPGDSDIAAMGGSPGTVTGPVRLVTNMQELREVQPGEIVVTQAIDPAWTPIFGIIGGVISEEGGMLSHATVLGREYGLPVVIGAAGATRLLQNGETVSLNGTAGTVRRAANAAVAAEES
ncbi:PEP/pyruvate-binding domain-containing protein [Sphingomonas agri]|uniref:PEP/pyruvate-binding domain-containing protein n=1 Tax=Sphingomonas agri TaxID=1813878 RepID=UPI00311D46D3